MRALAVLAVALLAAGCLRPGDQSPAPLEPRCGESPAAFDERRGGGDTDYAPNTHEVRVEAGDPWRIVLESGGAFGHHGFVEVARHEDVVPAAGDVQRQRLDFGPFCKSRLEFPVDPAHGPWVVTVLDDPWEGEVPVPEGTVVLVRAGPGANGTWEATVEPFWVWEPEFAGPEHNGSRPGPWFRFDTRLRATEGAGGVLLEDFAQAWGHAGDAVRVQAGLPGAFSEQPRTVRLVPLSPGLAPASGDPASWVDEGVGNFPTYYEVSVPPNGTWRLGIQADWEPMDYPVVAGGSACWVLSSSVGDDVDLRWTRMDRACR